MIGYKGYRSIVIDFSFTRCDVAVIINENDCNRTVFTDIFGSGYRNSYFAARLTATPSNIKEIS